MKRVITIVISLIICGAIFLAVVYLNNNVLDEQKLRPDDEIIAKVNGEKIPISMIFVLPIEEEAGLTMGMRLEGVITRKIAISEARLKGITVSEEEIEDIFNRTYAPDRDEETLQYAKEYIAELQTMVEALGRWRENPEDDEKIFKELQEKFPDLTYSHWQRLKNQFGKTDETFAKYKEDVNKVISMFQCREKMFEVYSPHIRDTLLYRRFVDSMPTEIAEEDKDDFLKFLKKWEEISQVEFDFDALVEMRRRQEIDQEGFDALVEQAKAMRKGLQQKYNFHKYIRAVWPKYEIIIFDENLKREVYTLLGLSSE